MSQEDEGEGETRILFSKDAEEAVLGAAIIDPAGIDLIDLTPEEFYVHRYRWVWQALSALRTRKVIPDYVTLIDELERAGQLSEIGGPAFITSLVSAVPNSQGIEHYAAIVRDKAQRRDILRQANELAKAAYASEPITESSMRITREISGSFSNNDGSTSRLGDVLSSTYDEVVERSKNPTDVWGIPTGFIDLDNYTGGLQPGESFYLAGQPGIGKSKLAHQIGLQMAMPEQGNHAGAIFSPEMQKMQMGFRDLSVLSNIETRRLKTGRLEGDDWHKLVNGVSLGDSLPVWLDDTARLTPGLFRAKVARLKAEYDIEWVVLDYLLLMEGVKAKDETEKSAILSREVRTVAKEFKVAMITVNSVVKEGMDTGKAGMSLMRGSGQQVHDGDLIAFLVKIPEAPSLARLAFVKFREGGRGLASIDFYVHDSIPRFDTVTVGHIATRDNGRVTEEWWEA
jgi:replicative DNA helicase